MNLELSRLIPTQSGFRNLDRFNTMTKHILEGGVFTMECIPGFHCDETVFGLIKVFRDSKDRYWVHDGHHRVSAMVAGGRNYLYSEEYILIDFDVPEKYQETNLEVGWVTPHDPQTHVRLPDTAAFKSMVKHADRFGDEQVQTFINNNTELYCTERKYWNFYDMVMPLLY